jgi:hypothetical protein
LFQPRRYEVTGTQPVLEHQPGDIFETDIPPAQEARLIASGALAVVPVAYPKTLPPLDIEPPSNPEQDTKEQ